MPQATADFKTAPATSDSGKGERGDYEETPNICPARIGPIAAFLKTSNIIDSATDSGSTADADITDDYEATPFQCSSVQSELEDDHVSETAYIIGFDCPIVLLFKQII